MIKRIITNTYRNHFSRSYENRSIDCANKNMWNRGRRGTRIDYYSSFLVHSRKVSLFCNVMSPLIPASVLYCLVSHWNYDYKPVENFRVMPGHSALDTIASHERHDIKWFWWCMLILFLVEEFRIVRSAKRAKSHLGNSCSNELVSLRIKFFNAFLWNKNIFSHIDLLQEGHNGVNRQPSNGLKFNRQKRTFFTVKRLKCRVILTAKAFQGISNLTILADLHGLLAPEKCLNWKNLGPCSQKQSLWTLQDLTTFLYLKVFWNCNM